MSTRNRMANLANKYQGQFRRVLCVCSAGMLRSPTVAWVLSNPPYNFNTRAVGLNKEFALTPIDEAMVFWADDVIVCDDQMERDVKNIINNSTWKDDFEAPNIVNWKIPDMYGYREKGLVEIVNKKAFEEYNKPGMVFADLENDLLCIVCDECGAIWYDENMVRCPNCNHRNTEV